MSLARFRGHNYSQQTSKLDVQKYVDDRALPLDAFAKLNGRFQFTVDVAASAENHKCARYYTEDDCGLGAAWSGERVYCTPPYSDIRTWVEKAWSEVDAAELIVMLLPANRTEQGWWHDLVELRRDRQGSCLRVEFLRGRQSFLSPGQTVIGPNERPPFGSCLLIWEVR